MEDSITVGSREFGRNLSVWMGKIKRGEVREVNVTLHGLRVWRMTSPLWERINTPKSAKTFREHADALLDTKRPGLFNPAMMELGALVCRPKQPRCEPCPVRNFCGAFLGGMQSSYPVRTKRRPVPRYHVAIGVVRKGDRILITRRKDSGHLGGLWEFPGGKVKAGESPQETCKREIKEEVNLAVDVADYLTHVDHAYTHFKIAVDVYVCVYRSGEVELNGPVEHRWIRVDEIDRYPWPGANHKFLPLLKQRLR